MCNQIATRIKLKVLNWCMIERKEEIELRKLGKKKKLHWMSLGKGQIHTNFKFLNNKLPLFWLNDAAISRNMEMLFILKSNFLNWVNKKRNHGKKDSEKYSFGIATSARPDFPDTKFPHWCVQPRLILLRGQVDGNLLWFVRQPKVCQNFYLLAVSENPHHKMS